MTLEPLKPLRGWCMMYYRTLFVTGNPIERSRLIEEEEEDPCSVLVQLGAWRRAWGAKEVTWKATVYDRAIHSICDSMRMGGSKASTIGAASK